MFVYTIVYVTIWVWCASKYMYLHTCTLYTHTASFHEHNITCHKFACVSQWLTTWCWANAYGAWKEGVVTWKKVWLEPQGSVVVLRTGKTEVTIMRIQGFQPTKANHQQVLTQQSQLLGRPNPNDKGRPATGSRGRLTDAAKCPGSAAAKKFFTMSMWTYAQHRVVVNYLLLLTTRGLIWLVHGCCGYRLLLLLVIAAYSWLLIIIVYHPCFLLDVVLCSRWSPTPLITMVSCSAQANSESIDYQINRPIILLHKNSMLLFDWFNVLIISIVSCWLLLMINDVCYCNQYSKIKWHDVNMNVFELSTFYVCSGLVPTKQDMATFTS